MLGNTYRVLLITINLAIYLIAKLNVLCALIIELLQMYVLIIAILKKRKHFDPKQWKLEKSFVQKNCDKVQCLELVMPKGSYTTQLS